MTEIALENRWTPNVARQALWLGAINVAYLATGAALFALAGHLDGIRSFVFGWVVSVVNLELIRRLGALLMGSYDGSKLGGMFYFVLFGKFAFWGILMAAFVSARWVQGPAFVAGMSTILIAGAGLGVKELVYGI